VKDTVNHNSKSAVSIYLIIGSAILLPILYLLSGGPALFLVEKGYYLMKYFPHFIYPSRGYTKLTF